MDAFLNCPLKLRCVRCELLVLNKSFLRSRHDALDNLRLRVKVFAGRWHRVKTSFDENIGHLGITRCNEKPSIGCEIGKDLGKWSHTRHGSAFCAGCKRRIEFFLQIFATSIFKDPCRPFDGTWHSRLRPAQSLTSQHHYRSPLSRRSK